jgi:hypothetical protein
MGSHHRADSYGFFWQTLPPEKKPAAEKVKRVAPEPTWLRPDYLPGLEEARRFPIAFMTDADLEYARLTHDRFLYDTECYPNYWCGIVRSLATGKILIFEKREGQIGLNDDAKFRWILDNICIVTFNGIHYDMPMTALALDGLECDSLKEASDDIIVNDIAGWVLLKKHKVKKLAVDHIDIKEVAPLQASLKTYGGRVHVPRMQDLPFHPNTILSEDQISIVRWYCVNDTTSTGFVHEILTEAINLRYHLSNEYKIDLRSKSDAQIAEAIIGAEYERLTGYRARPPVIEPGTTYKYEKPANLFFQTDLMKSVLKAVEDADFEIGPDGTVVMPPILAALKFTLGESTYQMGIGGLHSTEKRAAHRSNKLYQLVDKDVASFYPMIILNNGYFPEHLGRVFLDIYGGITRRRLKAKADGLKAVADSLKIVINGTYGKLGSVYSIVYAPKLLFHTTISGQLYLLMLTEALELEGISVVSGNTDGIMIKCPRDKMERMEQIVKWWEQTTGFTTEGKNYNGIYSRDINNYIAVSEVDKKGEITLKHKGAYYNPWDDPKDNIEFRLKKNPVTTVCIAAVDRYLIDGTPVEDTIRACRDMRKFIRIQGVTGGAVKDGEFLGKQIRWYYSVYERGKEIVRASNGHVVGSSKGGKPAMELPSEFPDDIDYEWYFAKSHKILKEIGAVE